MRESEGEIVRAELVDAKSPLNRAYSMADPPSSDGQLTLVFDRVKDGIGSIASTVSSPAMSCGWPTHMVTSYCLSRLIKICPLSVAIPD